MNEHTLSLRSRLRFLSLDTNETFLEVQSGFTPEGFRAILDAPKEPLHFLRPALQPALPAAS
jgi:hypothetical protein